jgi:DNA adenine methylase
MESSLVTKIVSGTKTRLTPPLKWHGGKYYLARRIIELMPPHLHYCEPFFGGGAVLMAKDPKGVSEVVNDIYGELINFWRVLSAG